MNRNTPPALASWLLQSVPAGPYGEAMLGDLIEEYALRAESTPPTAASRWFWSQTCRSVPAMVGSWLRSGDWLIPTGIALGVYVAMVMLELGVDLMIRKVVAPEPMTSVILAPIVFLATSAIGGCLASRIRRGATTVLALMVMVSVVILTWLKLCAVPVPWWYPLGFLTLGPLVVFITPALLGARRTRTGESAT
ncbi:MAG TPA: hypothetical protein VE825_04700 [Terriglobales bacterium]|jgi:hypothetical protein|nr:hypothetical protein [Terriglobales bacterium]